MKIELLKKCIDSFEKIRMQVHDKVEPSVIADLDSVIVELKDHLKSQGGAELTPKLVSDALLSLAKLIDAVSNLADIIQDLFQ